MLIDIALTIGTMGIIGYEVLRVGVSKLLLFQPKSPYILKSGNNYFDMRLTPHIIISGLSGQGKTKFCESLFINRSDIDIVMLNCFPDDFTNVNGIRINNLKDIKDFLDHILEEGKRKKVMYIIIDELMSLAIRDKKIIDSIKRLLCVARHYNIFIVAISQSCNKEEVGSKNLFNCRVCFRQVEYSQYNVCLGYSPEDKELKQREYYYLNSKGVGKSKAPIIR